MVNIELYKSWTFFVDESVDFEKIKSLVIDDIIAGIREGYKELTVCLAHPTIYDDYFEPHKITVDQITWLEEIIDEKLIMDIVTFMERYKGEYTFFTVEVYYVER